MEKYGKKTKYKPSVCSLSFLGFITKKILNKLLNSLFKKMNLNIKCPNYTSISKRAKNLKIKIKSYGTKNINHIAIVSTGLKVFGEGEWKVRQHGIGKRRTWRKLHLGVDVNNHQIMSAFLSKSNIHDREKFEDLVYSIDSKINEISADGAYDDKGCYEVIQNVGAPTKSKFCFFGGKSTQEIM